MADATCALINKNIQILEAANAEFLECGFVGASMDRISQRANVSKRTVYKHFQSKKNLFNAIISKLACHMDQALDIEIDSSLPIEEQLMVLGRAEASFFSSSQVISMSRMVMAETVRTPDLASSIYEKLDATIPMARYMRRFKEEGLLAVESEEDAAMEFIGLLKAKAFWPVVLRMKTVSESELEDVISSAVKMMMCRYALT
ncbi:TetR/AcrR family transcriptional regulator [Flexibacterium corallicola]|uniref:TetR/AcrR family transcriptional regulator n=1 Tax=Flexibacterium corallicola TaxID=3037259 RepID=UPI00286F2208|nr:TetR/AcrR family transcriptional regulator [Pseudovibrio sp. M1P-2-3]